MATKVQIIAPSAGSGAPVNPDDQLLQYQRLDTGTTLVSQVARWVFNYPGNESLRAIVESFLIDIIWVEVFSRHNFTDSPLQETVRVLTRYVVPRTASIFLLTHDDRRTITSGSETNKEMNIGAAYNGLSIGFGASTKTFSSTETVSELEVTTVYTVPPQSSLYVYQRRYRFREEIWWIADAWKDLWNVCTPGGGYVLLRVPFNSYIDADERMAIDKPLSGSFRAYTTTAPRDYASYNQINRQFHNHTDRTRKAVQRVINDSNRSNAQCVQVS